MSNRCPILIAAAVSFACFSGLPAQADSTLRTFFNPQVYGKPVALCMSDRASCGKPTADAWCREHGFGEALVFERLLTADKSKVFRQIKCISREQAVAATAEHPESATP
ncbi:hypothetical protein G5V57_00655 [Nordella sp. HKS 07]|uniref:hypothetical protein n=1 Tax=Nordella sp. HKS 07 TaxID=2712222 RepID=UPI0013E143A3|nr:hypothetical protein [Nordella sp. HKS 07]QIG46267.1 hypothetical protein G5V57_00655 [Nordella sp. HKS 07]